MEIKFNNQNVFGYIDVCNDLLYGWIASDQKIDGIDLESDGKVLASCKYGFPRKDVLSAFPQLKYALYSGFSVENPFPEFQSANFLIHTENATICSNVFPLKKELEELSSTREYFRNLLSKANSVLEIGPFTLPFKTGKNVKYFDVLDAKSLMEMALQINYPIESPPTEIHFVSPSGDLKVVQEKFDAVFSSHCLEHQVDIISHINDVFSLLREHAKNRQDSISNGAYYIFVPDARYCFDHFRPLSTLTDIIQAHFFKHENHSLKSYVEQNMLATHNDLGRHWAQDHGEPQITLDKLKHLTDAYLSRYKNGFFTDVHGFCFTGESFICIIKSLYYLGYIDCLPSYFATTPANEIEFGCILQKPLPQETSVVYNLSEHLEKSIIHENCTLENGVFVSQPGCEPMFHILPPFEKNSSTLELNLGIKPELETSLKIYYSTDRFSFSDDQVFSFPLRQGAQTVKINIPLETLPDLFYMRFVPVVGQINFTLS